MVVVLLDAARCAGSPLRKDLFNGGDLFCCEIEMLNARRIFNDLLRTAGTDQSGGYGLVVQDSGQRHLGQLLAAGLCNVIEGIQPGDHLFIQLIADPGLALTHTGILGNAVEVLVRQENLIQRREYNNADAVFCCETVRIVALDPAVEHGVGQMVQNKRCMQLTEDPQNILSLLPL